MASDLLRRVLFVVVFLLYPLFLLGPAAIAVAVFAAISHVPWWSLALLAGVWLVRRCLSAWRLGAPGEEISGMPVPRQAGDPLWDMALRAAQEVGAQAPSAIELVAAANAEVAPGADGPVLRIGLPLLACCPRDEIGAVVAHELSRQSLGHLGSWAFEARWIRAAQRLAMGNKPGFQRYSLLIHLRLADFVVLSDKRRDESEADRLAVTFAGRDTFAAALVRSKLVADAHGRGALVFFGVPGLAGLRSSPLQGVRDLTAAALVSDEELAGEGLWSSHPSTGERLEVIGVRGPRPVLAAVALDELALPWPRLLAAEAELDDSPAADYPPAAWQESWHAGMTAALRELVRDASYAWSGVSLTPRALLERAATPDAGVELASQPLDVPLAVAALAAVQQGVVVFDWPAAAALTDLTGELGSLTPTARGADGDWPLAALADAQPAEILARLPALGIDLDTALDLSRPPGEPLIVRHLFANCAVARRKTTMPLPTFGKGGGCHVLLLHTGIAVVPSPSVRSIAEFVDQIDALVRRVSAIGWAPDEDTLWIPREAVTRVRVEKRPSRVTISTASADFSFTTPPQDFAPQAFVELWGLGRISG